MHIDKKKKPFDLHLLRLDATKNISWILWIKMDKTTSAFGYKKKIGGGDRTIVLFLSYGWMV